MFGLFLKKSAAPKKVDRVSIGGVGIPRKLETRGFLFAGAPGTGKTQAITRLLVKIRERGERAIIADAGGEFLTKFFEAGDQVLAPGDDRSVPWSVIGEMESRRDAKSLANSIIPPGVGSAQEWNTYARTLTTALLEHLYAAGSKNSDLLHALNMLSAEDMAVISQDTAAGRLFEKGAERMLSSILAIIGSNGSGFSDIDPKAGPDDWTIRKFIKNEDKNWLFMPYKAADAEATKPARRAWFDLIIKNILDLDPSDTRRIWLIIDELPAAGQLEILPEAAARGRKYGLCPVLGFQSVSQIREVYGREQSSSILSCVQNRLILRVPDNETAKHMAEDIGQREVVRYTSNESHSDSGDSKSKNEQHATENAVLPSEIQRLKDLEGYLLLAGDFPIGKVKLPIVSMGKKAEAWIPKSSGLKLKK